MDLIQWLDSLVVPLSMLKCNQIFNVHWCGSWFNFKFEFAHGKRHPEVEGTAGVSKLAGQVEPVTLRSIEVV